MNKVAIITGITGQDGAYLARLLLDKKYRVIGCAPTISEKDCWRLDHFGITKKIKLVTGSLLDQNYLRLLLKKYQPQELYNFAGQSSVARSWEQPIETMETNALVVAQLLEALRLYAPKTKFFQASSAEIYGQTDGIITEKNTTFHPVNPYGISKLAAHQMVATYRTRYGLFAVNGILFNHESPLRMPDFVTKIMSHSVAEIARGIRKTFSLGSLTARRDFGYAADFVDGMWRLMQVPRPYDAVFCTGETHSIGDFAREAFAIVGIKDWRNHIILDPNLARKREIKTMRGDHRLLTKLTGWKPVVGFCELVKIMIDFEMKQ